MLRNIFVMSQTKNKKNVAEKGERKKFAPVKWIRGNKNVEQLNDIVGLSGLPLLIIEFRNKLTFVMELNYIHFSDVRK